MNDISSSDQNPLKFSINGVFPVFDLRKMTKENDSFKG